MFDMDGTILDTIQDLTDALNYSLSKYDYPSVSVEQTKRYFGSGIQVALQRALGKNCPYYDEILKTFNSYYPNHCNIHTKPFPKIEELITYLNSKGIITAVISNKNDDAVQILSQTHFKDQFQLCAGVLPDRKKKPSPDLLNYTLDTFQIDKKDAIYIGDSEIDIQTSKNANVRCIAVDWGFRNHEELKRLNPDFLVSSTDELTTLIQKLEGQS